RCDDRNLRPFSCDGLVDARRRPKAFHRNLDFDCQALDRCASRGPVESHERLRAPLENRDRWSAEFFAASTGGAKPEQTIPGSHPRNPTPGPPAAARTLTAG